MSYQVLDSIDFSTITVLVVGDVMLDRYYHGDCSRISPEAPVPVVHVQQSEDRPGGAGNVALNLAALGVNTQLMGVVGQDEAGEKLHEQLISVGIKSQLQRIPDVPTITKLRVISQHQQLVRLDFEEKLHHIKRNKLLADFSKALAQVDAVILSDYGKGTISKPAEFIQLAKAAHVPVFIDPKTSNFSDYAGATCITPNFKEFERAVGICDDEGQIVQKGQALVHENNFNALLITRSEHGMTLVRENQPELHIPTQAQEVFDVTGAGDTVISMLAASYAGGCGLDEAMRLANLAAGVSIAKLGASTVTLPELRGALLKEKPNLGGVLNEEQLMLAIETARLKGERIIMTNGCFDILHVGHVQYLQQAKALGDRLIVAVNDDESVKRLKGEGRPINNVDKRMGVLSGLSATDWVVPFSEDTPSRLITKFLPDVLVKGGDYKPADIVGSDIIIENGGEVKVLDFVEGSSTSALIDAIQSEKEI